MATDRSQPPSARSRGSAEQRYFGVHGRGPDRLGALPYRGTYGDRRPAMLDLLSLPPAPMPPRQGLVPLKLWRYVGVFGPELMICLASVRIGPTRQSLWAIWDRAASRLYERTASGAEAVSLAPGRA